MVVFSASFQALLLFVLAAAGATQSRSIADRADLRTRFSGTGPTYTEGGQSVAQPGQYIELSDTGRAVQQLAATAESQGKSAFTFDQLSLKIAGQRFFLNSGEFHPWRLPVERLWRDALTKLREAGFNGVSIYTHWGLIAPSPDKIDLSGVNDLGLFLDVAKEVGILVNVRLGPYINAETSAGGLPGWTQNLPAALRTKDEAYTKAWQPYIDALAKVISSRQLSVDGSGNLDTASGTVILVQLENEYFQDDSTGPYVQALKDSLRNGGVDEALFSYNEASAENPAGSFKSIVDLYGVDGYPQGFDCKNPTQWQPASTKYEAAQDKLNITTPHAIWEFQGGAFDPYDGAGYDKCLQLTNERFVRVFDLNNLGQDFKILSRYMAYGGTNWGNLAEPTVYSSYDYGAPIGEDLEVRDKLREYGLLGGFLKSSTEYAASSSIDSGVNKNVTEQSSDILVWRRAAEQSADNDLAPNWYIVRQDDSTSTTPTDFKLSISAGGKDIVVPTSDDKIHLDGRDARIISTNHLLPATKATLLYSTAPLSFAGAIGKSDALVLYGDAGHSSEAVLQLPKGVTGTIDAKVYPADSVKVDSGTDGQVKLTWTPSGANSAAIVVLNLPANGGKVTMVLADTQYAYTTRSLSLAKAGSLEHILQRGADTVLVSGGYHIANATLGDDGVLHLAGQSNATAKLDIIAPDALKGATFNGKQLQGTASEYGSYQVQIDGPSAAAEKYQPPPLNDWKYADSLPEITADFSDDSWVKADLTSTNNPYFSVDGIATDGKVLFSDAYGFHSGNIVWRGHFTANGKEEGLDLRVQGGSFFGGSAWLNDHFLGSFAGDGKHSDGNLSVTFPAGALVTGEGKKNVLTVLHDNTGLEEWVGAKALGSGNDDNTRIGQPSGAKYPLDGPKNPRGILSYSFHGGDNSTRIDDWRVQGNFGGEKCPDEVRKCLNEGGLRAEVEGWHLPGYDTSKWTSNGEGAAKLNVPGAGVRYFTTDVKIMTPLDHYVPIRVVFPEEKSAKYRALLYVNGWQFGKRLPQFGPQTVYPIPQGVLDPRGTNTIGVALWSTEAGGATIEELKLEVGGRFAGDVDYALNNPGYKDLRP